MGFDAVEQSMVDWPYGEIGLVHTERPFDEGQVSVILNNCLVPDLAVGHISLQPVQPCVLGYFVLVYGHCRLSLQSEESVVASVVDGSLRDLSVCKALFKPLDTFFPVSGILSGAVIAH